MSDNYLNQAWSLVNEYFHSNGIDFSKSVDHELVRLYLKASQKSTPKGVSISLQGKRLYLRFKTAIKPATANNGCNEDFTRDGCVNALAKALAVSYKLKETVTESEFWEWYEVEIKGVTTLENDIITIGEAIETVKNNYLSGYDKCGRDRADEKSRTNTLANYQTTYGDFHQKLNPELRLTGENLISEIKRNWGQLIISISGNQTLCSKGFKNAYTGVLKLLRDTRLTSELDKVQSHFGTIRVVEKTEQQTIDIETFLDFRARVLGLNGYELTKKQWANIGSRRSWMKALSINLIYGLRCSEFKAILNIDCAATHGDVVFPALSWETNKDNIIVLNEGYWVIDSHGQHHWVTTKTGERIARPMLHPDYPNLIELLDIKNPEVKMPEVFPKYGSKPRTIKEVYNHNLKNRLTDYIDQVGDGFTQTHALRHLANYHGKLSGLTRDQRALSLGHSQTMNDKYDKHLSGKAEVDLLMADISENSEKQRLKDQVSELCQKIDHLEETILFLKKENARLREQLGGNDDIPRIG